MPYHRTQLKFSAVLSFLLPAFVRCHERLPSVATHNFALQYLYTRRQNKAQLVSALHTRLLVHPFLHAAQHPPLATSSILHPEQTSIEITRSESRVTAQRCHDRQRELDDTLNTTLQRLVRRSDRLQRDKFPKSQSGRVQKKGRRAQ